MDSNHGVPDSTSADASADLHASEWLTITGRGRIAVIDFARVPGCPDPIRTIEDLPVGVGGRVRIDGGDYVVVGIEYSRAMMDPPFIFPGVGLIVRGA